MEQQKIIAQTIAAELKLQKKTQTELAKSIGKSRRNVVAFLSNETKWNIDDLQKVARFLGMDIFQLMEMAKGFEQTRQNVLGKAYTEKASDATEANVN